MANSLSTVFGAIVFFLLVLIASLAWHFGAWIIHWFDSSHARD